MECRLATLTLANGNEVLSYSADNAQLDLYDAQKSRIGFGRLSDLVTVPSMFQRLPDDTQVEELGDRIQIVATEAILVADRKAGFVHEMNSMRPDGSGLTVQQFGPVSHPNGAVTPTLRIEANFRNHTLDRAQVVFLDEVDFEAEFLPNAFSFAAPAGTNLLDYRDADLHRITATCEGDHGPRLRCCGHGQFNAAFGAAAPSSKCCECRHGENSRHEETSIGRQIAGVPRRRVVRPEWENLSTRSQGKGSYHQLPPRLRSQQ